MAPHKVWVKSCWCCLSRGKYWRIEKKCNWLQGPEFLQKYDPSWSENNISHDLLNVAYEEIEGKRKVYMKTIKVEDELSSIYKLFLKFLSWFKLKKIAAWVMRVRRMLLYRSKKRNYCAVDMPVWSEANSDGVERHRNLHCEVKITKCVWWGLEIFFSSWAS